MKQRLRVVLLSLTLVCAVLLSSAAAAGDGFLTRRITGPEMDSHAANALAEYAMCYADTGEVIPLSYYHDRQFFAIVPEAHRDRPIEPCVTKALSFTDRNLTNEWQFYEIERLSRLGVMGGNDRGEAEPTREITRAEAAAIIVRLLGAPTAEGKPYADVPADAWYAAPVYTAQALGVVMPDERFYPDRPVSRQEFVVMTARALQTVGLLTLSETGELPEVEDADALAEYARSAYHTLGSCVLTTRVTGGTPEEPGNLYYFEPQKPVTRSEAAWQLLEVRCEVPVYPSRVAEEFGLAEEMPVVDGSTSTLPVTQWVYTALFSNYNRHPAYPEGHSKTHRSYERLIEGEADLVFAGIAPGQDIYDLAEQQGVELELIPIGYDAMVFFTNEQNSAEGLTSEQITELYVNNNPKNWSALGGPDAALIPFCRNEDSGSHANMERYFLQGKPIHPDIRKEASDSMQNIFTDVVGAGTDDPPAYALGYSTYYYYRSMERNWGNLVEPGEKIPLKLLAIDGVEPTDETIADRSYPLADYIYAVIRKDAPENSPERKLVSFLLSPEGQACIEKAEFGPLR